MKLLNPAQTDQQIANQARNHLEAVVAIDSASDEDSATIPSTVGQATLARWLGSFFEKLGAEVEQDDFANIIATFPGRGAGAAAPPLALMVHLDTAKGTVAVPSLELTNDWNGSPIPWNANARLQVDTNTFPSLASFVGQDLLHGPGDAPFGLDDKLGLTHMMTLAWLLHENPEIPHPPLLLVGRPDEEIGRMEALVGLAQLLSGRGVHTGYTVDGIAPFEINVENFNAAGASIVFDTRPVQPEGDLLAIRLMGVNTHGATALAEGHRGAVRLAAELLERCEARLVSLVSDPQRDCDAELVLDCQHAQSVRDALDKVVAPHRARGASWHERQLPDDFVGDAAYDQLVRFVQQFLDSQPGFTLLAEDSEGHDGYSQPYRSVATPAGARLDLRLRDFTERGLAARIEHVNQLSRNRATIEQQYVNMGPRLEGRPELVQWAKQAAEALDIEAPTLPIRGGTGVDPFLDAGIAVGNLGTGYFAPESEKELTSMSMLSGHARWLVALVQVASQ